MNIFRLIPTSLGLGNATLAQVRIAYDRFVRFLLIAMLPALIISYLLNIGVSRWGFSPWLSYVPYILGLITSLIFMAIIFQPDILLLVGVANWAQGKNLLPTDSAFKPWQDFTNAVWLTVAWINIPFMFIGGVPAGANPFAVLAILSTITIISLISKKTIWRKVVMWSACIILSINLLTLISQPMWFWLTGDTMHFGATKTEVALTNVLDLIKQTEDEIAQKRLEKIAANIKDGKTVIEDGKAVIINKADAIFLLEQQSKAKTLPKKLSGITNELLDEKADSLKKLAKPAKPSEKKVPTMVAEESPQVVKPAPAVQVVKPAPPVVVKPVVEIWRISFWRDNQLLGSDIRITRDKSNITMLVLLDGTKFIGKSSGSGQFTGLVYLQDVPIGTFGVNLSGWSGSGWWIDNQNILFTMERFS